MKKKYIHMSFNLLNKTRDTGNSNDVEYCSFSHFSQNVFVDIFLGSVCQDLWKFKIQFISSHNVTKTSQY